MKNKMPFAVSLAAGAVLGAIAAAALEDPATASVTISTGADVGPVEVVPADEQHGKHTHTHGEHTPEEEYGSPDLRLALTGQAASVEQGSIAPGTSTAL